MGFLPSTASHQPSRGFVRYWDAFFKKRDYTEAYEHLGTVGPRRWSPDWCKIYTTSETIGSGTMAIQLEVFGGILLQNPQEFWFVLKVEFQQKKARTEQSVKKNQAFFCFRKLGEVSLCLKHHWRPIKHDFFLKGTCGSCHACDVMCQGIWPLKPARVHLQLLVNLGRTKIQPGKTIDFCHPIAREKIGRIYFHKSFTAKICSP